MIGYLKGNVKQLTPEYVLLEVGGVGYEVICSGAAFSRLSGSSVGEVYTYLHCKEDGISLFGFADIPKNSKIIDVGTGAGFPGLVLKLARPDIDMTFLDGTGKKLGFISGVLEAAGEKGTILHKRAEEAARLPEYRERYDFATARAVAAMPVLCEYCLPFVKKGGSFIAMKSAQGDEEIALAGGAVSLLGGRTDKVFDFELTGGLPRKIIIIKKISQTPTKYPRASAQISKKPLK